MEDVMVRSCGIHGSVMHANFWKENLKEGGYWEDVGIDGGEIKMGFEETG